MKKILIIARRELGVFFDSLIAYILVIVFLGLSGFFTWITGNGDVFFTGEASIRPFFTIAFWTLFFFIPALTMRMLAEEKKTGTIELLLTKAVTDRQVILGKFLACMALVGLAVLFTLPWYYTITTLGKVDHGSIITGYIGIMLLAAAYAGIGLFASSITDNQIVAFLLALLIGVVFLFIFGVLAGTSSGFLAYVFNYLSLENHYDSIMRGVLDTKDIFYLLSICFLGLSLAEVMLARRRVAE